MKKRLVGIAVVIMLLAGMQGRRRMRFTPSGGEAENKGGARLRGGCHASSGQHCEIRDIQF